MTDDGERNADSTAAEQAAITARYDRTARFYDLYDKPMDRLGVRRRRRRLIAKARGRTLEVGVGTGRNLEFYPPEVALVGIDISPRMLERARRASQQAEVAVDLDIADVHALPFDDDTFDTVVATAVFCSVADPIRGLRELARVAKVDGSVLLLEHVRPRTPPFSWIADIVNPVVRRLLGPIVNRRTERNVDAAGLRIESIVRWAVWREITAHPARQ